MVGRPDERQETRNCETEWRRVITPTTSYRLHIYLPYTTILLLFYYTTATCYRYTTHCRYTNTRVGMELNEQPVPVDEVAPDNTGLLEEKDGILRLSIETLLQLATPQSESLPSESSALEIRNDWSQAIILCWVDPGGTLKHFRTVASSATHTEHTHQGHAFICLQSNDMDKPTCISELQREVVCSLCLLCDECRISYVIIKSSPPDNTLSQYLTRMSLPPSLLNLTLRFRLLIRQIKRMWQKNCVASLFTLKLH